MKAWTPTAGAAASRAELLQPQPRHHTRGLRAHHQHTRLPGHAGPRARRRRGVQRRHRGHGRIALGTRRPHRRTGRRQVAHHRQPGCRTRPSTVCQVGIARPPTIGTPSSPRLATTPTLDVSRSPHSVWRPIDVLNYGKPGRSTIRTSPANGRAAQSHAARQVPSAAARWPGQRTPAPCRRVGTPCGHGACLD